MESEGVLAAAEVEAPTPGRPRGVVVIGSSAGGLEAVTALLRGLPPDLPLALVLAQHMAPDRDSALVELLARATDLEVMEAEQVEVLTAGHLYVLPPNADALLRPGVLSLVHSTTGPGPKPHVDALLVSAAAAWGPSAAAVLLSGSGHDGAAGAAAVATAGGLVLAQDPGSAKFASMPAAAAAAVPAAVVLAPQEVGSRLAAWCAELAAPSASARRAPGPGPAPDPGSPSGAELLTPVIAAVAAQTGLDFTGYKPGTVARQVARRLALTGRPDLAGYLDLISADPGEAAALARAMHVGVTAFFRDPQVWEALRAPLAHLLTRLNPPEQLRVWVPGCSTGQEAYTVAMLAADGLGPVAPLAARLKVFATDLSDADLEIARRGRFSAEDVATVPPALLERWMVRTDTGWEVATELRDAVVFARHNLTLDPPFPHLQLVTCRNTLIYFRRDLQERVLALFHFSLIDGGLLLLGSSERVVGDPTLFTTVDATHRVYAQAPGPQRALPAGPNFAASTPARGVAAPPAERRAVLRDALIARFVPPSVVVDADEQIIEVVGDVSPWCALAQGPPSTHVVALLREQLRPVVHSMLMQARHGDVVVRDVIGPSGPVRVAVDPLAGTDPGLTVLSFTTLPPPAPATGARIGEAPDETTTALSRELESVRKTLQSTIEDLGASNEELQALNEELQATSEELQASNEELQATNEELEVTNSELVSLAREDSARTQDLARANADLADIQTSMTSGLVLLDLDLRVTRFTPRAVRLFNLIEADLGRELAGVPTMVPVGDLAARLSSAREGGPPTLSEVADADSDFLLAVSPNRDGAGAVRGVIVTITDITELAAARRAARRAARTMTRGANALREAVWLEDAEGRVLGANAAIADVFGLSPEAVAATAGLLRAAVHDADRDAFARVSAAHAPTARVTVRVVRPAGDTGWVDVSRARIESDPPDPTVTVCTALDVTDQVRATQARHVAEARAGALFDNPVTGLALLDGTGRIVAANRALVELTGFDAPTLVGMRADALLSPEVDDEPGLHVAAGTAAGAQPDRGRLGTELGFAVLTQSGGGRRHVTTTTRPVDPSASGPAALLSVHSLDRLRAFSLPELAHDPYDRQTGVMTREHFRFRVAEELARTRGHTVTPAVLWVDLDRFKDVNDHYGHRVGDRVLTLAAQRLLTSVRHADAVGRLGGDEFALLITDVDRFESLELAVDRLLAAMREPVLLNDTVIYLTASVGVALSPGDGVDADVLLHNADTAMYAAKSAGRDRRAYYAPEMNRSAETRASVSHRIAAALRARDFTMVYQPIVAVNGRVMALEALLRWRDGDRLVPAGEFLPVAESTGQMRLLGRLAAELVSEDLEAARAGDPFDRARVLLNLSPDELAERDTFDRLAAWEPRGGFARLGVEVTETTLFHRRGRAEETLALLRRLGASLSIDDFGTGYSNLALLESLTPDVIKVDRSLLVAARSAKGTAVLSAAVALARAFAPEVVLEGVETSAQRDLATDLGVTQLQGFGVATPMSRAEVTEWLAMRVAVEGC